MKTTRNYIINGSDETEHSRALFGILPIGDDDDFDFAAKSITSPITVIKEDAFDKSSYPANMDIVIVECLPSQIKRQDAKTMTMRWGGNIAHLTTAGEYNPNERSTWRSKFWNALHS